MRNRILAFLTAIVLLFTLAPTFVHAASDDIWDSGTVGDISWTYTESGLLTIKGTGNSQMEDAPGPFFGPWFGVSMGVTEVVITGVAHLGAFSFYCFPSLQSITFDNCIQSIGDCAADGCFELRTVTFTGDPPALGKWAFPEEGYEIIHPNTRRWTKDAIDRFYSGEPTPVAPSVSCGITAQEVHDIMIALKGEYPEGRHWTNDNFYAWNGGAGFDGGYGCAAFAFILSDAAFGQEPSTVIKNNITIEDIRVGDILRVNGDNHSVVALEVHQDYIVLAEGNYNSSIHWGRIMTAQEIAWQTDYILTRYPYHTWVDATCLEPRSCMFCDATDGQALGHSFDGTDVCSRCGFDQNAAPCQHNWVEATCLDPRFCTLCGETQGDPLPHTLIPATCLKPSTCSVCGTTQGVASSVHTYSGNSDASCDLCGAVRVTVSGPVVDNITISATELELLRLTNRERLAQGLQPLSTFAPLQEVGRIRAREIKSQSQLSHTRPNGELFNTALYALGLSGDSGENLARYQQSPAEVIGNWMSSPKHRANILDNTFGRMAAVEDQLHWVQFFLEAVPYTTMQVPVPEGAVYETGTAIRDMGLKVYLTDAQGTVYLMPLDDPYCTGYDPARSGKQTVTVNLFGLSWDMTVTLAGQHTHLWKDATCEAPRTCDRCGETDGLSLGHDYQDGACVRCGAADPDTAVWGDANGDKQVNYLDAMLVLRHGVRLITLDKDVQDRCDVNRSGGLDYLDAMLILRYAVRLIDKLPITK